MAIGSMIKKATNKPTKAAGQSAASHIPVDSGLSDRQKEIANFFNSGAASSIDSGLSDRQKEIEELFAKKTAPRFESFTDAIGVNRRMEEYVAEEAKKQGWERVSPERDGMSTLAGNVWNGLYQQTTDQAKADYLDGALALGAIDQKQHNFLSMYGAPKWMRSPIETSQLTNADNNLPVDKDAALSIAKSVYGNSPYKLPETVGEAKKMIADGMLSRAQTAVSEVKAKALEEYQAFQKQLATRQLELPELINKYFGASRGTGATGEYDPNNSLSVEAEKQRTFSLKYIELGDAEKAYSYLLTRTPEQKAADIESYNEGVELGEKALEERAKYIEENKPGFLEGTWDTTKAWGKELWASFVNLYGYWAIGQQMKNSSNQFAINTLTGGADAGRGTIYGGVAQGKQVQEEAHEYAVDLYLAANADMQAALEWADAGDALWYNAYKAGLDLVADLAINTAAPGMGLVSMGGRVFARSTLANQVAGYDNADAVILALKDTAIEVASEKIFGMFGGIYGKSALGKATSKLTNRLSERFAEATITNALLKVAMSGAGESAEELIGGIADEYVTRLMGYDETTGDVITPEEWADIFYDAIVGYMLGSLGGGASVANNINMQNTPEGSKAMAAAAVDNAYKIAAQKGVFSPEAAKAMAKATEARSTARWVEAATQANTLAGARDESESAAGNDINTDAEDGSGNSVFTGEYSGKKYTAAEAEALKQISNDGLINAAEAGYDLPYNRLGITDEQAAVLRENGLLETETKENGDTFEYVPDYAIFDERFRRRKEGSEVKEEESLDLGAMTYDEQEDFLRERYADAMESGLLNESFIQTMTNQLRSGTPLEDMVRRADGYVSSEEGFRTQEQELRDRYADEIKSGIVDDGAISAMMEMIRGGTAPAEAIAQMDEMIQDAKEYAARKEAKNGEKSLRGSMGRQSDVGTGEQGRGISEGTAEGEGAQRRADTGREEARGNDSKKPQREKVSGKELKIPGATENKTLTVVKPKGVEARIVKAFMPAAKSITLVNGDIEQQTKSGVVKVSGLETPDGRIWARMDHKLYSGTKLLLHECGHLYMRDDAELRRQMHNAAAEALSANDVEVLANRYSAVWRGLYELPDGVESYDDLGDYFENNPEAYEEYLDTYEQEIFCDALAGLDRAKAPGASKLTDAIRAVFLEETGIDIEGILNGTVEGDTEITEAQGTAAEVEERETGPPAEKLSASAESTEQLNESEPATKHVVKDKAKPERKTVEKKNAESKLEDFGQKIGGARKDLWGARGLEVDDLDPMNEREREKNVKKDNVWKRPDYRELVKNGESRGRLYAINEIRKSLNQNITYRRNMSAEDKAEIQRTFVDTVRTIQRMAIEAKTSEDFRKMGIPWLLENGYITDTGGIYTRYRSTEKMYKNPALGYSNYFQTIEYIVKNFDKLDSIAEREGFAAEKSDIPKGFDIVDGIKTVGKEGTSWGIVKGNRILQAGFGTREEALEALKNSVAAKKKKTRFVPQQLLNVHRNGLDFRNGQNVSGQNYLDDFGFRGGEFGNWLNEKDRQVSLNYGYDALKDLAKALDIADRDISLGGNLSIAFGARGQGLSGASAHYEPMRHVINLTKMNGAGSLAHEWFHALDDFVSGYKGMATNNPRTLPAASAEAFRKLINTMQYKEGTQEETDLAAQKRLEQSQRSVTYRVSSEFDFVRQMENGSFNEQNYVNRYNRMPTQDDVAKYHELLDKLLDTGDGKYITELSNLKKEITGHVISKDIRDDIGFRLYALKPEATQNVQKVTKKTDFYNNSRKFGELHAKDGDYWDSTVEMAARAFACYVADKTGKNNDYLSGHSDSAVTLDIDRDGKATVIKAFPEGEERKEINAAFDNLISALKTDGFLQQRITEDEGKYTQISYSVDDAEGLRYSADVDISELITPEALYEAKINVAKMEPVADLTGEEFAKKDGLKFSDQLKAYFNSFGNVFYSDRIGEVVADINSVKSDVGHKVFRKKAIAAAAIHNVIKSGEIIDYQSDYDNRSYDTLCLAAPITIAGEKYFEGVVVRRIQDTDRFYTHNVIIEKEALTLKTGGIKDTNTGASASIISLLKQVAEVNRENDELTNVSNSYSADELDEEYEDAIFNNDMERAQELVDQAAKAAGYMPEKFYHGTKNAGFTVFEYDKNRQTGTDYGKAFYFTTDYEKAVGYAYSLHNDPEIRIATAEKDALRETFLNNPTRENQQAYLEYKYNGKTVMEMINGEGRLLPGSEVKSVYLKMTNPLIVDAGGKYYYEVYDEYFDAASKGGHDGIIVNNVIDNPRGKPRPMKTAIVFAPNQIKSADPVTYDDDGNVIPLSQRFKTTADDIRYSADDTMTAEEVQRRKTVKSRANSLGLQKLRERVASIDGQISGLERVEDRTEQMERELEQLKTDREIFNATLEKKTAKAQQAKTDRQKAKEAAERAVDELSIRQTTAQSRKALKKQIFDIYGIKHGFTEIGDSVDAFTEAWISQGKIGYKAIEKLENMLMDLGEIRADSIDEHAREVRNRLNGGHISVPRSVANEFADDWDAFRKRAFTNGIYLSIDTHYSSIDQWTQDLAASFGKGRFDETLDEKEQLENIVDIAEQGRSENLTVWQMADYIAKTEGETASDLYIEDVHEQLMRSLKSFAQSAKIEMETVKRSAFKEVRRQAELKERVERAQREKEQREFQQKTLKQLQWLKRNQNIMGNDFQEEARRILGDIDTIAISAANEMNWSEKYQATWEDLAKMYKWAEKNDPNFLPSKELENIVMRVEGKHLDELSASDLEEIYKAAVALRTAYYNRNNVINDELHRQFAEVFEESVLDMKAAPKPKKKTGKGRNYLDSQLNPIHRIERMFGWKENSPGFQIFGRGLEKGERLTKRYVEQANQMLDDWMTENEEWVRNSDGQGKDATWYELEVPELLEFRMGDKPIFGNTVKVYMTPMQKVYMYLESKNYDNLRHMAGGRTFADKELYSQGEYTEAFAQGTTVSLAPETVKKIVSDLTPKEMELANLLDKYFNGYAKEEINRVSNILYGYDRAMSDNYAPIFTNSNYNKSEPGIYQDGTAEGVGHMKTRAQGAKNPTYNISALQAFNKHVSQTSRFVGMAIPAQNAKTLLNWSAHGVTMQDHITHEWSQKELDSLTNVMTELQAPTYMEQSEFAGALGKIMSNYIGGVFGANLTVSAKVLASKPTAAIVLGNDTYPSIAQQRAVDEELVRKYTSELDVRIRGLGRPELAALTLDEGKYQRWVQSHKLTQLTLGGGLLQAADVYVAKTMWAWAENRVRADFPDLEIGTQEQVDAGMSPFYKKVAEVYENAIGDTQSMYDIMHRSDIMRDTNEITRSFTIFHTDSLQAANLLRKRAGELQAAKASGNETAVNTAVKKLAVAAGNVILMNALVVMFDIIRDLFRRRDDKYKDDEGELTFWSMTSEALLQLMESSAGMLIGLDAILPAIESAITGDSYFEHQVIAVDAFNDILKAGKKALTVGSDFVSGFADVIKNGGDVWQYLTEAADFRGMLKDTAEDILHYFSGIPIENVERLFTNLLGWVWPEMSAAYDGIWESRNKADLKQSTSVSADIMQLYSGRGDISGDMADELARLYEAGYTDAVMSDTPSSFTVDGEETVLTEANKQRYNAEIAKNLDGELSGLMSSPEYQAATDEQKTKMLSKLYAYATARAKAEINPEYDMPNWVEAIPELRDAGIEWGSITEALVKQSELNKTTMTAGEKATQFAIWIDNKGYTTDQENAIKEAVKFFSMVPAEAKRYEDLTAAGISVAKAEEINDVLNELTPQAGSTQVSALQKVSAVAYMTISEADKEKAMKVIYGNSEKAYNRYMIARKNGVLSADYADFLEELDRIDVNGGNPSRDDFTEAVARSGFNTDAAKEIWYTYWKSTSPWG